MHRIPVSGQIFRNRYTFVYYAEQKITGTVYLYRGGVKRLIFLKIAN